MVWKGDAVNIATGVNLDLHSPCRSQSDFADCLNASTEDTVAEKASQLRKLGRSDNIQLWGETLPSQVK